jgi:hypothetical protein
MTDFDNKSFETAKTVSGIDVENIPADWDHHAAASDWIAAEFDAPQQYVESFEALWDSNQDAISEFDTGDLTPANFGTDPQTNYEDFETQWDSNEDAISEFTSGQLTEADFNAAADDADGCEKEWESRHVKVDTARLVTEVFIDETPLIIYGRLNEIKADYNLHIPDAAVHTAADTTNAVTSADATDLATAITLATELWTDCWLHILDSGLAYHRATVAQMVKPGDSAFYPPTTYPHLRDLANFLTLYVNVHFRWSDNAMAVSEFDPDGSTNIYASLSQALFGGSLSAEGFEQDWDSNETAIAEFTGGDLTAAAWLRDGGTDDYEGFERLLSMEAPTPGAGAPLDISSTHTARVEITGTFVATLQVQVRRAGVASWLTVDEATAPETIEVPVGYDEVRINVSSYTSGSPAAALGWGLAKTI